MRRRPKEAPKKNPQQLIASQETSPTPAAVHLHLALWSGVLETLVSLTQPKIDLYAFPSVYQNGLAQVVGSARGPGAVSSRSPGPWSVVLRLCRSQSWIEKAVASRYRGLALVPLSVLPVPSGVLETLVFPTQLLASNYQPQCNSYVAHLICSCCCAGQFCCGGRRNKNSLQLY